MSEQVTTEHTGRRQRHNRQEAETQTQEQPMDIQNTAGNGASVYVDTIEMELKDIGITVELPIRYSATVLRDMVLRAVETGDDTEVKYCAQLCERNMRTQFRSSRNASYSQRAKRYAKDHKASDAPLSEAEIVADWMAYTIDFRGEQSMSKMERARYEAAWRMISALSKAHNDNVTAWLANPKIKHADGTETEAPYTPVMPKVGKALYVLPSAKVEKVKLEDGTEVEVSKKDNLIEALLGMPAYADAIQAQLDLILAEQDAAKGKRKAVAEVTQVSGADAL